MLGSGWVNFTALFHYIFMKITKKIQSLIYLTTKYGFKALGSIKRYQMNGIVLRFCKCFKKY